MPLGPYKNFGACTTDQKAKLKKKYPDWSDKRISEDASKICGALKKKFEGQEDVTPEQVELESEKITKILEYEHDFYVDDKKKEKNSEYWWGQAIVVEKEFMMLDGVHEDNGEIEVTVNYADRIPRRDNAIEVALAKAIGSEDQAKRFHIIYTTEPHHMERNDPRPMYNLVLVPIVDYFESKLQEFEPPKSGDAPQEVKDILSKVYSKLRQKWVDTHPDDKENAQNKENSAKIAWSVVKKAGWSKNKDGKWVKV